MQQRFQPVSAETLVGRRQVRRLCNKRVPLRQGEADVTFGFIASTPVMAPTSQRFSREGHGNCKGIDLLVFGCRPMEIVRVHEDNCPFSGRFAVPSRGWWELKVA